MIKAVDLTKMNSNSISFGNTEDNKTKRKDFRFDPRGDYNTACDTLDTQELKSLHGVEETQTQLNDIADQAEKNGKKKVAKFIRGAAFVAGLAVAWFVAKGAARATINKLSEVAQSKGVQDTLKTVAEPSKEFADKAFQYGKDFIQKPKVQEFISKMKETRVGQYLKTLSEKPQVASAVDSLKQKLTNFDGFKKLIENITATGTTVGVAVDQVQDKKTDENKSTEKDKKIEEGSDNE